MRQILYYYYNINFDIEHEDEISCLLKYKGDYFLFKRLEISKDLLTNNITILNNYNLHFHGIIINSKNEIISTYKNKPYVLLKIDETLKERWLDFNVIEIDFHEIEIGNLWSNRVDYYMNKMRENINRDILFLSIFNYYIGMSENAIAIVNRLKNNNVSLKRVLAHRRVEYPFNYINYYDPTEMILGFRVRDYSEYLKSKFFKEDIIIENEFKYIIKANYTNDEINFLLARLLYPSYYYDVLDRWFDGEVETNELLNFANIIRKYEIFLAELMNRLSTFYTIYIIEWIKK